MIDDIRKELEARMAKCLDSMDVAFARIRTGRAHPSLLDGVKVPYYGSDTPLTQLANISREDARTLLVRVWEKQIVPEVEKAILKSDLGLNPSTAGEVIRIPLPPLTEETRKGYIRQARQESENARITIRKYRREAIADVKELEKEKMISEDDERRAHEEIQKVTDRFVAEVDARLAAKEKDLLEV